MNPHHQSKRRSRIALFALQLFAIFLAGSALQAGTITVTTSLDEFDTPSGTSISLREALRDAAGSAGADTIVFTSFFSFPIELGGEIEVNDAAGVIVDASALPKGVTIDGGVGSNRIFLVKSDGRLTLRNLTLTGGNGGGDSPGSGGAIRNSGVLTLERCIITGNSATFSGGAIFNTGTPVTSTSLSMTDCTLFGNSCPNEGGAIRNSIGDVTLTRCTLSGNTASGSGGAVASSSGNCTMVQCTVSGNSAATGGGVNHIGSGSGSELCLLRHCTVVGNTSAGSGGGVLNTAGVMTVEHCLIAGNSAPANAGAGVAIAASGFSTTRVKNCIIAGNVSTDIDLVSGGAGSVVSQGNNRVGDGSAAAAFNVAGDVKNAGDPFVGPLADNGGPTKTHALLSNSPARNGTVGSAVTSDQRGFAIFGAPDIGAYELWTGSFSLDPTSITVNEGGGARVTINLTPGHPGNATVRLFTVAGTATAGDFTGRPNTAASDVVFADGESTKVVSIPITTDILPEGDQVFTVQLGTPTPATLATLGAQNTTTVTIRDSIVVTNTNDAGAGSLRQALADAVAAPGAQFIGFVPALNGQTIVLGSEMVVNDSAGVTVDASSLPAGMTIDGGGATRLLHMTLTSSIVTLRGMKFVRGNGAGASSGGFGGAIRNGGTLTLEQCTLSDNSAPNTGGAIRNAGTLTMRQCTVARNAAGQDGGGVGSNDNMTLIQCTFSGNSAEDGGAIFTSLSQATLSATLQHCTVVGNTATTTTGRGGGIFNSNGRMTLEHCIISRNTAPANGGGGVASVGNTTTESVVKGSYISGNTSSDVDLVTATSTNSFTSQGGNIAGTGNATADFNATGDRTGLFIFEVDPLLADNGGATQTHALLEGFFTRDGAVGSTIATDQRGLATVGVPDMGAFEVQRGGQFKIRNATEATFEGQLQLIVIQRVRDFAGTATVRVFTVPGSATAADFTARPNTAASDVTFADGETQKGILIPITLDPTVEGNHTFTVSLGSPTPAPVAALIAPSTCVVTIKDSIVVTNTNDDGPGSLRRAVATAVATPGSEVIAFAAVLNGKTITLGSEIVVSDVLGDQITIDASSLPAGLTIDGGPGTNRLFSFTNQGAHFALTGLNLTGGNGFGVTLSGGGGAIRGNGSGTLTRCTLFNNIASGRGGAIDMRGQLTMRQCTVSGNATLDGGGIYCDGVAFLEHCTIFGNDAVVRGGGIMTENGPLILIHSIVTGNRAPSGQGSGVLAEGGSNFNHALVRSIVAGNNNTDVDFFGTNVFTSQGGNHIGDGSAVATVFNVAGDRTGVGDPLVDALAANGGPSLTCALRFGSPAINGTLGSTVTSDQRGRPVAGQPDIGAFEVRNEFLLFSSSATAQEGLTLQFPVRRTGDLSKPASVRFFTTPGTAGPADFFGRPNTAASAVNFLPNQAEANVSINTTGADGAEPNETFTVNLGTPSPGMSLGTPASTVVVLRDPADDAPANDNSFAIATITFPASNAVLDVPLDGQITATGTASDNKAVTSVVFNVSHNINPFTATLLAPRAASTGWSQTYAPISGKNTIFAKAIDAQGNTAAPTVSRTFTVRRPLAVNISGVGSVTPGFAPSSFRVVGGPQTITATAGTGAIFAGWSVLSGQTLEQLGISALALEKPTLTVIHRDGLALRATFVPNPYVASAIGTFNGAIKPNASLPDRPPIGLDPDDGTDSDLSTEGYASFVVQPTGAFSGSLKIDGRTLAVAGAFDHTGAARFGTSRAHTLTVLRGDKPAYALSLGTLSGKISGTLSQTEGTSVVAVSSVDTSRAFFSTANPVPPTAFFATVQRPATGIYTTVIPVVGSGSLSAAQVPGGAGHGTITLAANGVVTVAFKLPDGTALTMATTVSETGKWRLFSQLYPGLLGFLAGDQTFLHIDPLRDVGVEAFWLRPVLDTQHYPLGWQTPITVGISGARYIVTAGASVVQPLSPATGSGNADLLFSEGKLANTLTKPVDISTTDVVTEVPPDASYALSINRTTGVFSGTFTHTDGTLVSYSGVMFQKAAVGGRGFFLTTTPAVKDYTGQGGSVQIDPR